MISPLAPSTGARPARGKGGDAALRFWQKVNRQSNGPDGDALFLLRLDHARQVVAICRDAAQQGRRVTCVRVEADLLRLSHESTPIAGGKVAVSAPLDLLRCILPRGDARRALPPELAGALEGLSLPPPLHVWSRLFEAALRAAQTRLALYGGRPGDVDPLRNVAGFARRALPWRRLSVVALVLLVLGSAVAAGVYWGSMPPARVPQAASPIDPPIPPASPLRISADPSAPEVSTATPAAPQIPAAPAKPVPSVPPSNIPAAITQSPVVPPAPSNPALGPPSAPRPVATTLPGSVPPAATRPAPKVAVVAAPDLPPPGSGAKAPAEALDFVAEWKPQANARAAAVVLRAGKREVTLELVALGPDQFIMGDDSSKRVEERPAGPRTVGKFYVARYETTRAQYGVLAHERGTAADTSPPLPASGMSWTGADLACRRLARALGPAVREVRLPWEHEWEYAAMSTLRDTPSIADVAWCGEDASSAAVHPIGQKRASPDGVYDLLGNVSEWINDDYVPRAYLNPTTRSGSQVADKVYRGGSAADFADHVRPTRRYHAPAAQGDRLRGFRIVIVAD